MRIDAAPMEGITDDLYRRVHHEVFPGVNQYYTPFISTCESGKYSPRDSRGLLPENNEGIRLVPQIMTRSAEQFVRAAQDMKAMGFQEVNLNLGCPSGTVTAKGKGAGLLARAEELEQFLNAVFDQVTIPVSIKTRIGFSDVAEWEALLELFNRYPIHELIVHPRIRQEFYQGEVHMDAFLTAMRRSTNLLVYNGNVFTQADYERVMGQIGKMEQQNVTAVMCGRGLIRNPALIRQLQGHGGITKDELMRFHALLYEGQRRRQSGDTNVLHHMKELWFYMGQLFERADGAAKKIKKAGTCVEYEIAVKNLFRECELADEQSRS